MDANTQAVLDTAVNTVQTMLPAILAGIGGGVSGNVALVATSISQLLQLATTLQQAGAMTSEQLAVVFAQSASGIQKTHDSWIALNKATA